MIEQIRNRFKSKKNAVNFSNRRFSINDGNFGEYQNDDSVQTEFTSNHVRSSKYTIFSFLFLNFLEQFRRTANFCYLCIAIIQVMSFIAGVSQASVWTRFVNIMCD